MRPIPYLLLLLVVFSRCKSVVLSAEVHASIMNRSGDGQSLIVHCKSGDNDLGKQTVADGGEFAWDFNVNIIGTTLFYCYISWDSVNGFQFDAYSHARDWLRCESKCLWIISKEGVYGANDKTGFWEFMYFWPS